MKNKILDGKYVSKKLKLKIIKKVNEELKLGNRAPSLAVILVGSDIASSIYVTKKRVLCKQVGFISQYWNFPNNTPESNILTLIKKLNNDVTIDGILVQLPIPNHINTHKIFDSINPKKDVDGFHPYNLGRLCQKKPLLRPCTPFGIITLLKHYHINIQGMYAVIIGASNIVGRPMSMELLLSGCTTTITHRFTYNLKKIIKQADLIVIAIGKANFLKGNWIKPGAIIIDVGINRLKNGTIVGDVDFNSVYPKSTYITPVPGGVGPMTVITLLNNTFIAYKNNYLNNLN